MLDFIWAFNGSLFVFFTVFYLYQIIYTIISLLFKIRKTPKTNIPMRRYAVMVAARDEEAVIAELIRSIRAQDYPQELLDIYVIADNCSDKTAEIAQNEGAEVFVRSDLKLCGKGYALDYAFGKLKAAGKRTKYDGFFVFDADNIVDPHFVSAVNEMYDDGYVAITGYRNSKNFSDNLITSSYSIWFMREAVCLNKPRMILDSCCTISGTGYMVRSDVIEDQDGWKQFLLTEDIEFNVKTILAGKKIGYCEDAIFYDEQPRGFRQSWHQRLRWVKGTYQVLARYSWKLFLGTFRNKFLPNYDMLMSMAPALLVTFISVVVNLVCLVLSFFEIFRDIGVMGLTIGSLLSTLVSFYFAFACIGTVTVITEWKKIRAKGWQKILSIFTFPLFIFTYIPISIVSLFCKIEWIPIKHSVAKSIQDMAN